MTLGCALMAVLLWLGWDDLLGFYYLSALRTDSARLERYVAGATHGSPQEWAIDEYLKSRGGKEALFASFVRHLTEEVDYTADSPATALSVFDGGRAWFDTTYSGRKLGVGGTFCDRHEVFTALERWLGALEGQSFRVPGLDGFVVAVVSRERAVTLYRTSVAADRLGSVVFSGDAEYVCRVLRDKRVDTD